MPESEDAGSAIQVTAALLRKDGRWLITRRPTGSHLAGLWEFPGGKIRPDETPEGALRRELEEELGVSIAVGEPITFATHEEEGLSILLLFFAAEIEAGKPRPREGQEIAWVPPAELPAYPTPPADAPLVRRLASEQTP